jgi:hypothetical protein
MLQLRRLLFVLAPAAALVAISAHAFADDEDPPPPPWCYEAPEGTTACECKDDGSVETTAPCGLLGWRSAGCVTIHVDVGGTAQDFQECLIYNPAGTAGAATHEVLSNLHYWVVNLVYAPPGAGSTVQYMNGKAIGTKVELKSTNSAGRVFHAETNATQVDGKFEYGSIDGSSFETKRTTSWGTVLNSTTDADSHLNDTFYLWINPTLVSLADVDDHELSTHLESRNGPVVIVPVSVAELAGRRAMPQWKVDALAEVTPQDRLNILSIDPWAGGCVGAGCHPQLDTNRFVWVKHIQINGPDYPGGAGLGDVIDISDEESESEIKGTVEHAEFSVQFGGGIAYGVETKLFDGYVVEWEYEKTKEDYQTDTTDATTVLTSSTVCYHQGVDVYFDTLLGTYAFDTTDPGSTDGCGSNPFNVLGMISDPKGASVANREVRLHLKNGATWVGYTNAKGMYRFNGVNSPVEKIETPRLRNAVIVKIKTGP